jgi:hypothetical protein
MTSAWVRLAACRLGALALATGMACASGSGAATVASEDARPRPIGAPHYGDTLFNFYQDKTFTALSGLMVSQHFARVGPHEDEAEVLRGGMLLSYGLHREAGNVFARLIDGNASLAVRNRAWYYLALMQHRRNLPGDAGQSLARITAPLAGALEDERQLLTADLLMERGDYPAAAQVLQGLQGSLGAGPYARFNLGVAWIKSGGPENLARGQTLLNALGQATAPDEALRSLRDRANVALGFAALQAHQPGPARESLQRVRLNGPQSNKALLGLGWASAELNEHRQALVPWTELAERPDNDAAVLEARIAVPYAMAEIGAQRQALQAYQAAAEDFDREQAALQQSVAAIRDGRFVRGLEQQNPGVGLGAFPGITDWPEMPHAGHLLPLVASHAFQEGFKNLRDLQFLDGNLQQWQDSLATFTDMLDNRRRAFEERLPKVRAAAGANDFAGLQRRREDVAQVLGASDPAKAASPEGRSVAAALADARQRDLLQRLERARATLAKAAAEPDMLPTPADVEARLRRAAGALEWQLAQELPARFWEATKSLRQIDAEMAQAQRRDAALRQAEQDEPARQRRFADRIAELSERLGRLRPAVTALAAEQAGELQGLAVAELNQQQERLTVYAGQARLAIAQIHDRAQFARNNRATGPLPGSNPLEDTGGRAAEAGVPR